MQRHLGVEPPDPPALAAQSAGKARALRPRSAAGRTPPTLHGAGPHQRIAAAGLGLAHGRVPFRVDQPIPDRGLGERSRRRPQATAAPGCASRKARAARSSRAAPRNRRRRTAHRRARPLRAVAAERPAFRARAAVKGCEGPAPRPRRRGLRPRGCHRWNRCRRRRAGPPPLKQLEAADQARPFVPADDDRGDGRSVGHRGAKG